MVFCFCMKSGIIIIDKEMGFTSFDVIAKLRGILQTRKLGHTGTLDPDATGVLPVCIGKGTKVCDLLTDMNKTYETVLLLGQSTDTQDISGTVLQHGAVTATEEEVRRVIASMIGKQLQTPPMYSAKKIGGKKLYELAREGVVVEREPASIEVFAIEILWMELPRVAMRITCSKGTYIRTICNDIGEKLGCFGCMEALRRTQVGPFDLDHAYSLSQVEEMMREGTVEDAIYSIDSLFMDYDGGHVKESALKPLINGNGLALEDVEEELHTPMVRLYHPDGRFAGIYQNTTQGYTLRKNFLE